MSKVIVIDIDGTVTLSEVDGYRDMQKIVGGLIEDFMSPAYQLYGYANEDGLMLGLQENRAMVRQGKLIVGPVFFSRCDDEGETIDVTDEDILLIAQTYGIQ